MTQRHWSTNLPGSRQDVTLKGYTALIAKAQRELDAIRARERELTGTLFQTEEALRSYVLSNWTDEQITASREAAGVPDGTALNRSSYEIP